MGTDIEKFEKSHIVPKPGGLLGVRHAQYFLLFSACVLAYGMRAILNIAIVEMINDDDSTNKDYPTYPSWSKHKNVIISSFFWGYICLQVGAGQLAKNYGPKLFLCVALLVASIFSALIPLSGDLLGFGGVIGCRIIQGLAQGFLLPSISNLLSLWAPASERARWGAIVYAGQAFGNVIAMPITGTICASKFGWPIVFYVYGGFGILWCTMWIIFGADRPAKHKTISLEERQWIESGLGEEKKEKPATPWKSIFSSLPFFAVVVSHCGQNWGYWTLLTEIPTYMQKIMGLKIASNSYLSALPYFVMWLLNFGFGSLADRLVEKKIVRLVISRKIFNSIGFFIPALALISLSFVDSKDRVGTTAILAFGVGMNAAQYSGFNINHIDLSPTHAGTLMAITNSAATVCSILAPLTVDVVASITGHTENEKALWNVIFCISACAYLIAGCTFIIFGSGDVQPWNGSVPNESKPEHKLRLKMLRKRSVSMTM